MQKKVLIIDDEYFFRQALIKYMQSFAAEFCVVGDAGNGILGLELIERHRPDIILIDINMPQMTGFDVIRQVFEKNPAIKFIVISGYDRFEYAQQAIKLGVQDFLLKPVTVENLYKSLKKVSDAIDETNKREENLAQRNRSYQNYMRHFAASQFVREDHNIEQMKKLADEIGYKTDAKLHIVILYHVTYLPNKWKKDDYELYYFMVDNVFCELLGDAASCVSYTNFQGTLCFVVGISEEHAGDYKSWLEQNLRKVIEICDSEQNLQTAVSVGKPSADFLNAYNSYIHAFSLEKKILFYEKTGIYFAEGQEKTIGKVPWLDEGFKTKFLQAMRQNQRMLVKEMIQIFVDSMVAMQLSMDQFLMQVNVVLSVIMDFAREYGVKETVSHSSKLFLPDFMNTEPVSGICAELLRYAEYILRQVHTTKNSNSSAIVWKIKEYVKVNYMDTELCLEQIAEKLDVNMQYMCFLFKKQTDSTIGAYILKTRMEMAKRLFQRTGLNVSEVSGKVGFDDTGYFSKCFKKYFGVSPKQYQNICHTEK